MGRSSVSTAWAVPIALKSEGRKRWHDADALMADIIAKRLVRYLERACYVVMKRPPLGGHSRVGQGLDRRIRSAWPTAAIEESWPMLKIGQIVPILRR